MLIEETCRCGATIRCSPDMTGLSRDFRDNERAAVIKQVERFRSLHKDCRRPGAAAAAPVPTQGEED